ncbi:peptidase S1 [Brevundimonas sp. R86498]|uniref:peptidase S1 n=1 Tax=Brevundimonas sp. R86498 TaxID=3093845 RepID=UPI0037C95D97
MKNQSILSATLVAATVLAGAANAQNASLNPNSGQVQLRAGFSPDPYTVSVVAGGSEDGNGLPGTCTGWISDAPDFRVTYTAGSLPLAFRTVSEADTTLIVNDPNGNWSCDDDSFGDGDAQVVFRNPASGVYDIWIGTYSRGSTARAVLGITETP